MKKFLLIAVVVSFAVSQAHAQIKLGNNPTSINTDALLEIESSNKGLLLPRVALTNTTTFAPLTAHVAGMTVYNTATAGDVTPGTYYNDGTKWVKLADASAGATNLYNANGTLTGTGTRTVTMGSTGNNSLSFLGTAGSATFSNQFTAGLRLTGSSTNRADIVLQAGNSYADWYVDNNNIIQIAARGNALSLGTRNAYPITFGTNNRAVDMALDASGNLGIGTASPSNKLHVTAASNPIRAEGLTTGEASDKYISVDATGVFHTLTATKPQNVTVKLPTGVAATRGANGGIYHYSQNTVLVNTIEGAMVAANGDITIPAGTYQIAVTTESRVTSDASTPSIGFYIHSYFYDFPTSGSDVRVHGNTPSNLGGASNHGVAIIYTTVITTSKVIPFQIGYGQGGNVGNTANLTYGTGCQISITKLQ